MDPSHDPEAQTERKLDDTNDRGIFGGDNNKPQDPVENYGDPSGKLWSMYLTEAKKEDEQITNNWTEDTQGVLVFTGLFSAIVAGFIALSLPQLSPDSAGQTVALLTQLVNNASGIPIVVQNPPPPFIAKPSIVRVNVLWFLSLILSLSCALLATLMQQWARGYLGYAQHRGAPRKQARIRAYMFEGVEKFHMSQAVEAMPFLLHTSVFLFFAGLVEFLFTINNAVARYTLGCIVFFASIYVILTLLPTWRLNYPYRTPLSEIVYSSFQFSATSLFWVADWIEGIFHGLLMDIWQCFREGSRDHGPTKWREALEEKFSTYYERLSHGLKGRVVGSAMKASPSVDVSALRWTLNTLDEDKKWEDFAARMPGFFDSQDPEAASTILSLMSDQSTPEPILGSRLRELLNTCQPGASLLTEDQRNSRLRVCLTSLWYCVRAYNLAENSNVFLARYVRAVFASSHAVRWFQTEKGVAVRLLGRCFGSLVVKKLANDIASRPSPPITTEELDCLSSILGAPSEQVWAWLAHEGAINLKNINILISGELETLVHSGVPTDVVDVFQQTLGILAEGISQADTEWDTDHVEHFHQMYSRIASVPVPDELRERLRYISDRLPPARRPPYMSEPEMEMPCPESTPGIQVRVDEVRVDGAPDSGTFLTPISALLSHGASNFV